MNTDDAKVLLAYAAAIDNRKPSEAAADAFADALADIPLDEDCRTAIATYYGTPLPGGERHWLQPHHVRSIRAAIRADRVTAAHPLYEGEPTETGSDFVARRRQQLAAAANGQLPAQPIRAALEGPPHPTVAAALGSAFQPVPGPYVPEQVRADLVAAVPGLATRYAHLPELAIPCPVPSCRARPRRPCHTPSGRELHAGSHPSRRDAYAAQQQTA